MSATFGRGQSPRSFEMLDAKKLQKLQPCRYDGAKHLLKFKLVSVIWQPVVSAQSCPVHKSSLPVLWICTTERQTLPHFRTTLPIPTSFISSLPHPPPSISNKIFWLNLNWTYIHPVLSFDVKFDFIKHIAYKGDENALANVETDAIIHFPVFLVKHLSNICACRYLLIRFNKYVSFT